MEKLTPVPFPRIGFAPPRYVARFGCVPFPLDGKLDKPCWAAAPFTDDFADIEGPENRPAPEQRTRAKMLWDDTHLFIGVELTEKHIWATLTERDSVIFYDNDIEFFLDPKGTTHEYAEIEINALGTVWDLLLTKPYRDGGTPVDGFDIKGLEVGIHIDGRLNDPTADNRRWTVEVAIPWASIFGDAGRSKPPVPGDFWRMNISRVTWRTEAADGAYRKIINPETDMPYPEDNWVWAPTGLINIHYPELWGYVFFEKDTPAEPVLPEAEQAKWALRQLYYRQRAYYGEHGCYAKTPEALGAADMPAEAIIETTRDMFQITLPTKGGAICIRQDGYVWEDRT